MSAMNQPLPQAIAPDGFEATEFGFSDQIAAADVAAAQQRRLIGSGAVSASAEGIPETQVIGA